MGGEGSSIVRVTSTCSLFNLLLLVLDVPLSHSSVSALTWVALLLEVVANVVVVALLLLFLPLRFLLNG